MPCALLIRLRMGPLWSWMMQVSNPKDAFRLMEVSGWDERARIEWKI